MKSRKKNLTESQNIKKKEKENKTRERRNREKQ